MTKNKNCMIPQKGKVYESPRMEVIFIEPQGVLCGSALSTGTRSMNMGGGEAAIVL